MIENGLDFLLHTLLGLFVLTVMLRFYMQLTNAPFRNPFSQAVVSITNFAVIPIRRIIPSWGKIDLSTLILAFLIQFLLEFASLWIHDFPIMVADGSAWLALLGLAFIGIAKLSVYIFLYATIAQAILSWVNPHTPIGPVLDALTRPILMPIRRIVPMSGGMDFSPLVAFIVAQLLLIMLITPLEQQFLRLL